MTPTLAVCCVTDAPPNQVSVAFEPFRALAEQFVLVYDDRVPPDWVAAYERLADRCVATTFAHLERHLALLHELCTTDWVLRVDSDEVPSGALLGELPRLITNPEVAEYRIARRWLYCSANTWLDEIPWTPDHQVRLVRRSADLLFSGELHTSADAREPAVYVEAPLYHLDLLLNDHPARRLKALRYEVTRPGLTAAGGLPMWSYYNPEDFSRRPLGLVDPGDDALIAPMLTAASRVLGELRSTPLVGDSAPEPINGAIEWLERDRQFQRRSFRRIVLRVSNATGDEWDAIGGGDPVRLRLQWGTPDGEPLSSPQVEPILLPIPAGQSQILAPSVLSPDALGPALLRFQLWSTAGRGLSNEGALRFELEEPRHLPLSRESRTARRRFMHRRRPRSAIPRVLHRIWLGGAALPEQYARYEQSWRALNPGWTFRLWTDADVPTPPGIERARNLAERTDLIRYEILRRHGGVYADTDVECLRPFDELLEGVVAFAGYEVPGRLCNALIGAVPGHRAFHDAVGMAPSTVGTGAYPFATATTFLTLVLEPLADVTLFSPERFYPYLWNERDPGPEGYGAAYAVHHWAGSWVPSS